MPADPAYLAEAARAIRTLLNLRGQPCEISYRPAPGRVFDLVFVPVGADGPGLRECGDEMDGAQRSVFRHAHPETFAQEGWCLLSWIYHGSAPFRLSGPNPIAPTPATLHSTLGPMDDHEAAFLAELLAAVCRDPWRDPEQPVSLRSVQPALRLVPAA